LQLAQLLSASRPAMASPARMPAWRVRQPERLILEIQLGGQMDGPLNAELKSGLTNGMALD